MRRLTSSLPALVAAAGVLGGCVSGQDATNGAVRFVNAVPDGPRMSLYLNDRARASGFDFNTGSAWVAVAAGTYAARLDQLLPDGPDEGTETDLRNVFTGQLPLGVNEETTLVVVGNFGAEETIQIDSRTDPVPIGKTRVRFVHGAVGGPSLDIYITDPDATIDVNTPRFASGLAFKAVTDQVDIGGGSLRVVLTPAGQPGTVVFDSGTVFFSLESNLLVTIMPNASFDAGSHPFTLLFMTGTGSTAVVDEDTQTSLRFANASPGAYALDAFVNETGVDNATRQTCDAGTTEEDTLIESCAMPFGYIGPFEVFEPGTYDLKVQHTGDAELEARATTGTFLPLAQSTVLFTGLIDDEATDTAVGFKTIPSTRRVGSIAQLRIIDQSLALAEAIDGDPTTDRIELYITGVGVPLDDEDPDFFGLRVGSDTGYFGQLPGSYQLTVTKTDTAVTDAVPEVLLTQSVGLDAGGIYTLILVDSVGGIAPISFLSLDDDPAP